MSDQHLIGTEGDDFLQGAEGNDWLEGLGGNDVLLGGAGDDLYMPGAGVDYLSDFDGFDELSFAPGISPDQVERIRLSGSYDLILRVAATGEQVTIGGWFYSATNQIERVVFDDGTVWNAADTSSLRRLGTAGDDFVQGTEYDERLEGRGGNDVLLGGAGNDVYVPGFGGSDWVSDFAGDDELRLDGVSPDQIERIRQSGSYDLVLRVAGTGDQITLGGWFYDAANQIERIVFDDDTVWDAAETSSLRRFGTAGDDFIQGTEYDERLDGRGGNDVLLGGAGNDVYVPGFGGSDWVSDFAGDDELRLDGVSPDQIERIRQSGSYDLVLRVAATGDQVTLGGWFYDATNQIERIVFDDRTVWNAAETSSLRRFGTAGDDFLQGTEYDERLEGRGGNDVLLGGAGNDTYVPGFGGSDWVSDFAGDDELRLDGVSPEQIERMRPSGSYDLVLRVAGTGDQVTLGGWFYDAANQIERVVFDDGTVWDPATTSTLGAGSNHTPFVASPIADQSATENSGFSFAVPAGTFADPDTGDVLTLSARLAGGEPLPAWLSFDPATATFSGTPPFGTAGSVSIEVIATDSGGLSAGDQFDIGVAAGVNEIYGSEGNDFISGSPGNDLIWAGAGDDEVWGLEGHDAIYADVTATPGNDTVYGGGGSDFIYGGGGTDLLVGGSGDDSYEFISGTTQVVEYAGEGHDQVGVQDSYVLPANVEDLRLYGAAVYGTGNELANLILGTGGDNRIDGRGGADNMQGFTGNDTYVVDDAGDLVFESSSAGTDTVESSITYALGANVENLVLTGAVTIDGTGNARNNVLTGNAAANVLTGGLGDDTYVVDPSDTIVELFNEGSDTVLIASSYALGANLENLTLSGSAAIDGTGNGAVNVIRGNSAANTLRGEFGNDSLYGFGGDDVLDGGVGHDTMVGGAGDDTYYFDFGSDTAVEVAGEGTDTVISSIGIDLDDNVENLVVIADVAGYGGGNALDNIITGSAVGDFLVGYAGNDTLYGGAGYDWLRGYEGADSLYGQADLDDLFGFTGNDYLDGGEGNDRLDGGAGDDTMVGGSGDDLYIVDDYGDVVIEAAGEGVDTVESSLAGYMLPDEVENLTLVGAAAGGTGNDGANVIIGNDLDNSIAGRGGDDILIGAGGNDYIVDSGAGNDRLSGGGGSDFLIGLEGDDVYDPGFGGQDTVYDTGGNDEARMGAVAPDQVERIREGDHLVLRVAGTTDSVTLYNWFSGPAWQIEQVSFDDATVWDAVTTASLRYLGSAGDDFLQGSWYDELLEGRDGNDQLAGGYGSDTLVGGRGSDTYVFDWLSGDVDTVRESQADFGDVDTLRFAIWITPDDLVVTQDGLDLQVAIAGQSAAVRFEGWFDPAISSHVERFEFQDGTVLSDGIVQAMINDAPVVASPIADLSSTEDAAFSFALPAGAFADADPYDSLSYAAALADGSALPSWLAFDGATFSGSPANGDVGTISVRVTATDEQGLSVSDVFELTVANTNDAPTLVNAITDQNATEDAPFSYTLPAGTFADADLGDSLTYATASLPAWLSFDGATRTFSGTPANGDVGVFSVRVTATDGSGASVYDEFDLSVTNTNDAPVAVSDSFSVDEDWALWLGRFSLVTNDFDVDPTGDLLTIVSVQGALHGSVTLDEWQNTSFIPDANYYGPAGFQYTISDGHGGFATGTASINVLSVNDEPTVASPIADQMTTEDALFTFTVPAATFADVESSSFTYAASLPDDGGLPAWLSFDEQTATFSGTPTNDAVGVLGIKVTARDAGGLPVADVFDVVIANTNDAPERGAPIPQQEATEDAAFSYTLGEDAFIDVDAGDTLTYAATQDDMFLSPLPAWLSFDPATRTFSGTPVNADVGFTPIRVSATDAAGAQTFASFWLGVINTNDAPTLANPIADQAASEDAGFSFTVPANTFSDVDAGEFLTYGATLADGAALPGWLSFNFIARTFAGTPLNADVGILDVRVTATDSLGVPASDVFRITVANTNDAPTLASPIADRSATEDSPFNFTVPANAFADIDVGDFLDYAATLADGTALPSWLLFDSGTRTFSGTPANGDVGTIAVRVTATDQSSASAADVFGISVANTNDAPTLANAIADQGAQDTLAFSFTLPAGTFADMDAGDSLTYATGALPGWLSFNASTQTFSGTPGSADLGVVSIQITATDSAGAQAPDTFNIDVGAAPDRTITGTAGNDTLNGASGNDTINGLAGADAMAGGLGNDAYFVDNAGDQVTEAAAAGDDTVNSAISYTLGDNVENLVLTGTGNINGTGNSLDNWLTGNSGKNTLAGGAGNDTYVISQSTDSVSENAGNGVDTVRASIAYTLGNNVENLVLTGTSSINGTGNNADNWLTGNDGSNTLRGQGGADSLSGGAGNDTLTGGSGTDGFYFLEAPGAANADHITDFGSGERLYLDDLVHPGIGAAGNFAPNDARFFAAPGASGGADASDRVIYDTTSGRLYFDADGSGAAAPSLIAILDNVFSLSASQIAVI